MRTKILILGVLVAITLFSSCHKEYGDGNIMSEVVSVGTFTKIDLRCAAEVEIYKGAVQNVEISDYENLIHYLEVETINNCLVIKTHPNHIFLGNSKAKVIITVPDVITNIELSGSGHIYINDSMNNLQSVEISGSGSLIATPSAYTSTLSAEISGSGECEMSGTVPSLNTEISGSGRIYFGSLSCQNAVTSISGSGNTTVNVTNSLKSYISGSGNIYYYGNPTIYSSITGSGKLIKK